jgi:hypothetical protein
MLDGLFWFDAPQWAVNFLCIAGLQLGLRSYAFRESHWNADQDLFGPF